MARIVTLTLNPTVDKSATVDRVAPEIKMRAFDAKSEAGGGGINVARVLHRFGDAPLALYPAGGPNGALVHALLQAEGVAVRAVPIAGGTRESFTAFEEATTYQYRFNLPGPAVTGAEVDTILAALEATRCDYLVASGSLPPGLPDDFYGRVADVGQRIGARVILDTSGSALREGLAHGGFYLVKPNMRELTQMLGVDEIDSEAVQEQAAHDIIARGQAEMVLVSLGAAGALFVTAAGCTRLRSPTVPIRSKVGAGDSMVAGTVHALAQGWDPRRAAQFGVATGSAAVMTPGTELAYPHDVTRLFAQIEG